MATPAQSGATAGGGNFWQDLTNAGLIAGDWTYYANASAKEQEYTHALQTALAAADPTQRQMIVDYLFDSGAAQGDRTYWYDARGAEDMDLARSLGSQMSSAAQPTTPTTGPAPAGSTPQSGGAPGTDNFWNQMVSQGLISGDPNYYISGGAQPAEYQHALTVALAGADPAQRKLIVDYLFDSGAAQGDRTYWYESRGAEDKDLTAVFGGTGYTPGEDDAAGPPGSNYTVPDSLRGQALQAALDALAAEYDLSEGQLGAERDQFANIFEQNRRQIEQGLKFATEQTYDNLVDRGILRSGLSKQSLTETAQPFADQSAQNIAKYNPTEGALGSEYGRIESALKLLQQQEDAKAKQLKIDSEREQLEYDQQMTAINQGL